MVYFIRNVSFFLTISIFDGRIAVKYLSFGNSFHQKEVRRSVIEQRRRIQNCRKNGCFSTKGEYKRGKEENMKRTLALVVGMVIVPLILAGCMTMGSGIAPSTAPITADDSYTEIGPAAGSAWGIHIMGLLPISESGTDIAVNRALTSSGGDALINVTMDNSVYMLMVVNLYRTRVEGTAIKLQRGARR